MNEAVMQRARLGDEEAFERLVHTYTPVGWRTAVILVQDRALAEDAMQEAWVDVWRALPTFREEGSFRAWFLAIVANRCHKMLRRHVHPILSLEQDESVQREELTSEHDTEAQALRHVTDVEMHRVLATLNAEQRTILELYAFADLTLSEIALVTKTPPGTIKSRFHRALQTLRAQMAPGGTSLARQEEH